jgi:frataxin-like iron-binding protein CyaY
MGNDKLDRFFEDGKKALQALEEKLLALEEDDLDLDVETVDTKQTIKIREPKKADWVLSTNSGAYQMWVAAVGRSFKLDQDGKGGFVLKATGQTLQQVIEECLTQHIGRPIRL